MRNYRVKALTKNCGFRTYGIDVMADNAKEAKELARLAWPDKDRHLFQLEAKVEPRRGRSGLWALTGEMKNGHWIDYV